MPAQLVGMKLGWILVNLWNFEGSEIGPPRDLTAVDTTDTSIQLAWLPPHPETSTIVAYRLKYGPSSDSTRSQEMILKVVAWGNYC